MTAFVIMAFGIIILIAYRYFPRSLPYRLGAGSLVNLSKVLMIVVVSLTVLGSALYVILSNNYEEGAEKWAFGAAGTVIGFWLRPEYIQT